jgi:preprotein translocase subunit SecF
MFIVKHRKIFYTISITLIAVSLFSIFFWGLKPGIDFTGGSLLQVSFDENKPTAEETSSVLNNLGFGDTSIRTSADGYILRLKETSQTQKDAILQGLSLDGKYIPTEKTFSSVGPTLGNEAIHKAWISVVLVLLAIVFFIAFAFRKVSRPISSWVYGGVTVLALLHDVLVPAGLFAILGHFLGFEIDTLFVTALLVILGFSVHDTIVVFDRVRENLHNNENHGGKKTFETIVGESINQTFIRSINTSLTTLLAVLALYIFGPETVKNFTLALLVGIFIGTYSSIFIASTLLVTINNWKKGHAQK